MLETFKEIPRLEGKEIVKIMKDKQIGDFYVWNKVEYYITPRLDPNRPKIVSITKALRVDRTRDGHIFL